MTTRLHGACQVSATVDDAIEVLRHFEGGLETISTIYLVDEHGTPDRSGAAGEVGAGEVSTTHSCSR